MSQLSLRFRDADQDPLPGLQLSGQLREDVLSLMARALAHVCRMQGRENHEPNSIIHEDHPDTPGSQGIGVPATVVTETAP